MPFWLPGLLPGLARYKPSRCQIVVDGPAWFMV
jgi:hypothetical protein